ncbi:MAG: panE [Firmicutes bacterium]|nr:panE [Bacillota bacterium]
MKIAIIGAGAMGSLFGAFLARANEDVWLLDVRPDHISAIRANGLRVASSTDQIIAHPHAVTDPDEIGTADLIIVFVKAADTSAAASVASKLLTAGTTVLTLQNGYGNAEQLAKLIEPARIIAGTTAQGATFLGPGQIKHGGNGETIIGELIPNPSTRLNAIAAIFSRAGIPTTTTVNVTNLLWGKLIINVGINALTGITGLKNGEIADFAETSDILRLAVLEAAQVAAAAGISLPYDNPVDKVLAVARKTAENRSSMLQDLDNNRLTEIDAINGVIISEGAKLGIATPVNTVLTNLIKTLSKKARL